MVHSDADWMRRAMCLSLLEECDWMMEDGEENGRIR